MTPGQWVTWASIAVTALIAMVYVCWPQYWTGVVLIVALAATLTFGVAVARRSGRPRPGVHAAPDPAIEDAWDRSGPHPRWRGENYRPGDAS